MQKYYKCQYRFNASHSMDNNEEHAHKHTFTVTLYISRHKQEEDILFHEVDALVKEYFSKYEHTYLNSHLNFRHRIPNIENMGDVFFEDILDLLEVRGIRLYQLDVYDNPLNIYEVSTRVHLPVSVIRE